MRLLPSTRSRVTPRPVAPAFVPGCCPDGHAFFKWCRIRLFRSTGAGAPRVRAVGGIGARSHAWPWVEIPRLGRQQRPISPTNTDPEERAAQSALGLMPKGLRDCGRIGFAGQCAGLAARLNRNRVIGSFLGPVTRSNRLSQGQLFQRSHLAGWLFTFYGYPTTRQRSRSSEKGNLASSFTDALIGQVRVVLAKGELAIC